MEKSITYVGMDVHKKTVAFALAIRPSLNEHSAPRNR